MSKAQIRALKWLANHGGLAQPDRWCRMVARDGDICKSKPDTWLRLFIGGYVAVHAVPGAIGITIQGLGAIS